MPGATVDLVDLADLKMLPAWVNEPAPGERYAQHDGEEPSRGDRPNRRFGKKPRPRENVTRPPPKPDRATDRQPPDRFRDRKGKRNDQRRPIDDGHKRVQPHVEHDVAGRKVLAVTIGNDGNTPARLSRASLAITAATFRMLDNMSSVG